MSLFFIDEVAKYKRHNEAGEAYNGECADVFEQEYTQIVGSLQRELGDEEYMKYLGSIPAANTHAGYFSIDKKSRHIVNSRLGNRKERTSDDRFSFFKKSILFISDGFMVYSCFVF